MILKISSFSFSVGSEKVCCSWVGKFSIFGNIFSKENSFCWMIVLTYIEDRRSLMSLADFTSVDFIFYFMIILSIPVRVFCTFFKVIFTNIETRSNFWSRSIKVTWPVRYNCSVPVYIISHFFFGIDFQSFDFSSIQSMVGTETIKKDVNFPLMN